MRQRHACPNGHHWEVEGEAAARACPTCGQAAVAEHNHATDVTVGLTGEQTSEPRALPAQPGYEVLGVLGRGGMGVVYKVRHLALNRVVALKMILSGNFASEEDRRRFHAEAIAMARLQHPNVVALHEIGERGTGPDATPFFTMDYCPGSLVEKMGQPWTPRDAAVLIATLARAVQHAHERGVVHRDLKPANVLYTEDGTPKIADFGLARKLDDVRRTVSGAIMGTPAYMAPEQAGGKTDQIGPAADVWALGVILYELLAGRPPFHAEGAAETLVRILSDEPPPPRTLNAKVHRDLETIALKCLHKDPARRYGSAKELADDLRRFLDGEPITARPRRWWQRLSRRQRAWAKTGGVALLGALLMLGLLVGFGLVSYYRYTAYGESWRRFARHRNVGEFESALADLNEAHRLLPHETEPLVSRAWVHRQMGNADLALEDYQQALKLDPRNTDAYRSRGQLLLVLRRYDEAADDLTKAIEYDPDVVSAYVNRANAYLNLQRFADAQKDLDRAVTFEGVPGEAYYSRMVAYAAQGHYSDCPREFDRMAARGWSRAEVWFSHAALELAMGKPAEHQKMRDRLLALADATEDATEGALAARACTLTADAPSDATRLERLVEPARKAHPDDPFPQRVEAQVWLHGGKANEALRQLTAVLERAPHYSPGLVRLLIALAQKKLGHKAEARRAYDQAVKDGVPVSHVHETLEYQILLIEAKKTLAITDKPAP